MLKNEKERKHTGSLQLCFEWKRLSHRLLNLPALFRGPTGARGGLLQVQSETWKRLLLACLPSSFWKDDVGHDLGDKSSGFIPRSLSPSVRFLL